MMKQNPFLQIRRIKSSYQVKVVAKAKTVQRMRMKSKRNNLPKRIMNNTNNSKILSQFERSTRPLNDLFLNLYAKMILTKSRIPIIPS